MTDIEKIVTKLSRDFEGLKRFVQGNGTMVGSIAGRLETLENRSERIIERLEVVENYPCKDGCLFEKYEEKEEEMSDRKKTYRIGDIANIIQVFMLAASIVLIIISTR